MNKEWMESSFDGTKLFVTKKTPVELEAIAVIVHGLAEHSGRYSYVENRLLENKIGVYKFDHRGHGKSEGEEVYYEDYNDLFDDVNHIVELAKTENPELPIFVIGHSMGGLGVTGFGAKYPGKVDGIVTSGAATRDRLGLFGEDLLELDPHMTIPNELGDGICSVEQVRKDYVKDPLNKMMMTAGIAQQLGQGIKWLKENSDKFVEPVLLLHGEKDALVSYKDSIEMFENIGSEDKQIKIYGDLQHEIFNEYAKPEVVVDTINWIKNRI